LLLAWRYQQVLALKKNMKAIEMQQLTIDKQQA
jgi:hypothetical protein